MEEEEEVNRLGLPLRHSLTSLGKRRPFSRKPSSWRHPGGTVSETEETDLSETESRQVEFLSLVEQFNIFRAVHCDLCQHRGEQALGPGQAQMVGWQMFAVDPQRCLSVSPGFTVVP